ncbi:MAG: hypothetical protein L0227_04915 [Chloroflexi bacterium]|nr:hypothetical protein [Chloroflexota bacterium]
MAAPGVRSFIACLAFFASACVSDGGGWILYGLNESDHDVFVRLTGGEGGAVRLPAKTWGNIFVRWGDPVGTIVVLDDSCGEINSWPAAKHGHTVVVTSGGDVALTADRREDGWTAPPGLDRMDQLPAEECP